mmetsp:Transcript_15198/g.44972  ORF Transcript_15198/g.44972 Transcript_15198/m.44972 type:complete len:251 (-) Transcript_15198:279-1031(-)
MNSLYATSPLPSLSKMLNTASQSSLLKSIVSIMSLNLSLLSKPCMISPFVRLPELSMSISMQILSKCLAWFLNSFSFSRRSAFVSLSAAFSEDSTTIDKMTFKIIKFVKRKTPMKKNVNFGSSSMSGMETWPQLSPVTICCVNVSADWKVDSNARGQRSHPSYRPDSAILLFTGWTICTAIVPNKIRLMDKIKRPDATTLMVEKSPLTISANCGNCTSTLMLRASRRRRSTRKKLNEGVLGMANSRIIMR